MTRLCAAAIVVFATTGIAAACPNWQMAGAQFDATDGQALWSPSSYSVTAGGGNALRGCGFSHSGYVVPRPVVEVQVLGLHGFDRLNIRVVAECDTVLLVHDASGQWWFNDDGPGTLNPSLDIHDAPDGVYDIWVGTYGPNPCDATLSLETF